jgi:TolA-binding protein
MMEEIGHIDLFERYRHGDLNDLEMREFQARLVYDAEFKEHFEHYQYIELGIATHFRSNLKSKLIEFDQTLDFQKQKKSKSRIFLVLTSSIAACLIVGFILIKNVSSNKNADLANQYWPEEPGLPVKMSSKGKYDDAMNAYKLGDLEMASSLLKKIPSDTSNYFHGVIAFEMDNTKEARRCFIQIEKNSAYFQKAQFRLGLILLSESNVSSAKKIFKEHVEQNSDFSSVSEEILKKI